MEPIIVSCPGLGNVDITPIIIKEAQEHNIDPHLIKTVIKFESGFCATAVSPAGACGLMQLMPDTASGLGVSDVLSPYENIAGGVHYIRRQLDNFNNNVAFALAAYNAGPGAVMDYGGIPPYEETQNYVRNIMADYLAGGRVARRTARSSPSEKAESCRKIDMQSTLSRMRGAASAAPAGGTITGAQGTSAAATPEMIPINTEQKPAKSLLENRSIIQGNPLENRPSATVPGY
jgi:SLT domain-containing protein